MTINFQPHLGFFSSSIVNGGHAHRHGHGHVLCEPSKQQRAAFVNYRSMAVHHWITSNSVLPLSNFNQWLYIIIVIIIIIIGAVTKGCRRFLSSAFLQPGILKFFDEEIPYSLSQARSLFRLEPLATELSEHKVKIENCYNNLD